MALSICETQTDLHDMELSKHGDPAFPIACYTDDLSLTKVPWHWHDEWEYAIVHEGCPEFFLENQHVSLHAGDGIFINGKALHAVKNDHTKTAILHSAVFHPRLIGGSTDSIYWQTLVQPFLSNPSTRYLLLHADNPWESKVLDHFHLAWKSMANDCEDCANIVRYELSAGIGALVQHNDFSTSNMSDQELINAKRIRVMLEYIEAHYNEKISVDILSDLITVSASVCLRCFHNTLHTTPMQYVRQLRIKKAADLLHTTNKSAKDIAFACGFNDMSYFTRSFKEVYGQTPIIYRKTHGKSTVCL